MADYHIYLHNVGGGDGSSPTKPKTSSKPTQPMQNKDLQQFLSSATNIQDPLNVAKASVVAKAGVVGATVFAAIAVNKVINKVGTTIATQIASESGDYRFQVAWENTGHAINFFANPIGSIYSMIGTQYQLDRENRKKEQERYLLGDSVINSYRRKV